MTVDWKHSHLEVIRRTLARFTKRSYWQAHVRVSRNMKLPKLPEGKDIWGIAMVKNEADIIESLVLHLFSQEVDAVLIVDNGSADDTVQKLVALSKKYPVFIGTDTEVGYFQDHKMSRLARHVGRSGAKWIIPVDADEFWFARGSTLGGYLRKSQPERIEARIQNVFPSHERPEIHGPRSGKARLDLEPHKLPKVAAKAHPLLWFAMGNHLALRPGDVSDGLYILHYPWRSEEQFTRKLRQGALAMHERQTSERFDTHWQREGAKDDADLARVWAALLDGRGDESLGWTPKGPFVMVDPSAWRSWQLDDQY